MSLCVPPPLQRRPAPSSCERPPPTCDEAGSRGGDERDDTGHLLRQAHLQQEQRVPGSDLHTEETDELIMNTPHYQSEPHSSHDHAGGVLLHLLPSQ